MKRRQVAAVLAVLAATVLAAGCGTKPIDYTSVWSSAPATPPTTVTIWEYLDERKVSQVPLTPVTLTEFTVSIPRPAGWAVVNDPSNGTAFEVVRKTDVTAFPPTAIIYVFQLNGDFDVKEAIQHGNAEAELSPEFKPVDSSTADFHGMPSAMIQGSYKYQGEGRQTYNRVVIATGPAPNNQRYIVQLAIVTSIEQAKTLGPDVDSMISGFTIAPAR